jgi:hypothetical protein
MSETQEIGFDQGQEETMAASKKEPSANSDSDLANLRQVHSTIPIAAWIVVGVSFFERLAFNAITSPLR